LVSSLSTLVSSLSMLVSSLSTLVERGGELPSSLRYPRQPSDPPPNPQLSPLLEG
jgi:hypothetical protein